MCRVCYDSDDQTVIRVDKRKEMVAVKGACTTIRCKKLPFRGYPICWTYNRGESEFIRRATWARATTI